MMKIYSIVLAFLIFLSFGCEGDTKQQGSAADPDTGKMEANLASPALADQDANSQQAPLTLAASNPVLEPGEEGCVEVMVADFYNLLSMQYTMQWDPQVLAFSEVKGFNLPYLGRNSFGAHRTAEGLLTFVWIDDSLQGKSLIDGSTIFQVCFKAVGQSGQSSFFKIVDQPTPFEVVNHNTQLVPLKGVEGKVTIR